MRGGRLELEPLAEEGHDMILKSDSHRAEVRAGINLKLMFDAVAVERIVQATRINPQAVLIAHIQCDTGVLAQVPHILIDEGQRRVGGPLGKHFGLRCTPFQ